MHTRPEAIAAIAALGVLVREEHAGVKVQAGDQRGDRLLAVRLRKGGDLGLDLLDRLGGFGRLRGAGVAPGQIIPRLFYLI